MGYRDENCYIGRHEEDSPVTWSLLCHRDVDGLRVETDRFDAAAYERIKAAAQRGGRVFVAALEVIAPSFGGAIGPAGVDRFRRLLVDV